MIIEMRTYSLKTGSTGQFLKLYESEGMAIQLPILGAMVGFYSTEIGSLNDIVHLWAYPDMNTWRERRQRLREDKRWQAFVPQLHVLIEQMDTQILTPAPFFTPGEIRRA